MKNKKIAAYLGITLFALAAGCQKADDKLSAPMTEAADTENPGDVKGVIHTPDDSIEADSEPNTAQKEQKTETLKGNVSSISGDSFVLSQSFEEGEGILVSPTDGSPEQVQITARVLEQTQYEVRTVKNGGVNGDADVEKKSGSFLDVEQDSSVDLVGYYEGEEFVAEKIVIYRFV